MVATTKQTLKRIIYGNWKARLARFLFLQHILPCTTTGKSPAELLMNRRLTSLLDRLHPDLNKEMRLKKEKQVEVEANKQLRQFQEDDPVYIRNYSDGASWIPAKIVVPTGPVSYKTQCLSSGDISRRHVDQIRSRISDNIPTAAADESPASGLSETTPDLPVNVPLAELPSLSPPILRRSERSRSSPKYLKDYVINS